MWPWYSFAFHVQNLFSSLQCYHQVGIAINSILTGTGLGNLSKRAQGNTAGKVWG